MDTIKDGVQGVVNEIIQQHGAVTAAGLVEAARPKSSAAHAGFEWDNGKAGHQYRLMQARQWIRRVEVIYPDRTERLVHVPMVVTTDDDGVEAVEGREGYYKPMSVVVRDRDEYLVALEATKTRLLSAKKCFESLKQAASLANEERRNQADLATAERGFKMVEAALG